MHHAVGLEHEYNSKAARNFDCHGRDSVSHVCPSIEISPEIAVHAVRRSTFYFCPWSAVEPGVPTERQYSLASCGKDGTQQCRLFCSRTAL